MALTVANTDGEELKLTLSHFLNLGFTKQELPTAIRRLPSLLWFSITTNPDPKYKYLLDSMNHSCSEHVQFPQIFSYNLAKRIILQHSISELFSHLSHWYGHSKMRCLKRKCKDYQSSLLRLRSLVWVWSDRF